jgi:hypothetical protein
LPAKIKRWQGWHSIDECSFAEHSADGGTLPSNGCDPQFEVFCEDGETSDILPFGQPETVQQSTSVGRKTNAGAVGVGKIGVGVDIK